MRWKSSLEALVNYVELHCHSNVSFLDGAAHPEELAQVAAARGLPALAITDHNGLYGMVRFDSAARKAGVKPLIGCELTGEALPGRVPPAPQCPIDRRATAPVGRRERGRHHLTLLVADNAGFRNLCRL